jgi:predicted lipoprotein with Yx(FWY)xxD motif
MRSRTIAGLGFAAAALLAACGQAAGGSPHGAAPAASGAPSASAGVHVGHTSIGDVLVDSSGRTLYGFTNDKNGTSSCEGTCARNWPPLEVGASWKAGTQAASADLHTSMRTDGHLQLAAGKWPLYVFSGDSAPGDVNGEGALGKWFAVGPDGTLLMDASATATPPTSAASPMGYGY